MDKLRRLGELVEECDAWRREGRRIVWTNGCFDLFHAGHVRALENARALGDRLVVGLNSDRSVRALKGEGRPLCDESDRAAMLSALEAVSRVVVFDGARCDRELAALKPDVWAKSGDYAVESLDATERAAVLAYGGRIVITPLVEGLSSTLLVKKIRRMDPEKIISAASAFVQDDSGRLLMVATRYADGIKWGLPGGGHLHGESLDETVRREALEETGIDIEPVRHMGVIERIEREKGLHLTLHLFAARPADSACFAMETFPQRSDEYVADAAWFTSRRIAEEPLPVLGRRLWLELGGDPAGWPSYLLMRPGEE